MKIEFFSKIKNGRQDGAIFGEYFFSFNHKGECSVYQMKTLENQKSDEAECFSEFVLDKHELIVPHSNAVMFGNEFYKAGDEFPLLYTNLYNNYADAEDKLKGVCLVYRLQRVGNVFKTTLVQMIEIGFVENETLWKSTGNKEDIRPYGNFTIDVEKGIYYAFTMRDNTQTTRYFSFELPKVNQGEICEKYSVKKVVLTEKDILQYFDCDYHHFVQGACCYKGKIYSVEGFTDSQDNPPAMRIIDTELNKQICYKKFSEFGMNVEAEMIDYYNDICYYTDNSGNMYRIVF